MLRVLAFVLLLSLGSRARAEDAWWARDKALHFSVSIALGAGGYGLASPFAEPRWARAAIGGGFSLTIGGAKELWDIRHGDPSWRDFTWDVAGTAVGVALAYLIDLAVARPARHGPWRDDQPMR